MMIKHISRLFISLFFLFSGCTTNILFVDKTTSACFSKQNLDTIKNIFDQTADSLFIKKSKIIIKKAYLQNDTSCNGLFYVNVESNKLDGWHYIIPILKVEDDFVINYSSYLGKPRRASSFSELKYDSLKVVLSKTINPQKIDTIKYFFELGVRPNPKADLDFY